MHSASDAVEDDSDVDAAIEGLADSHVEAFFPFFELVVGEFPST